MIVAVAFLPEKLLLHDTTDPDSADEVDFTCRSDARTQSLEAGLRHLTSPWLPCSQPSFVWFFQETQHPPGSWER